MAANFRRKNGEPLAYVVRHPETDANENGLFRGFIDFKLNATGKEEAAELADFFKGKPVAIIYSSDLSRATETAKAISHKNEAEVVTSPKLRPWDVGDLAGKSKVAHAATIEKHVANPTKKLPGGESLQQFQTRFRSEMKKIFDGARVSGQTAIVVAHASNAHELGNMANGDPDSTDIAPGGVIEVHDGLRRQIRVKILRGEQKGSGTSRGGS
jgi:broad specificity phosphatase PhoE